MGSSSSAGAPASRVFQYASCRSSVSPGSWARCHTAKSAYCTGSGASGLSPRCCTPRTGRRSSREEHAHAPPVAGRVVDAQQQHVLVVPQAQQRGATEGARGQVERPGAVLGRAAAHLDLARLRAGGGEVHDGQREARERRDHLHGDAVGSPRTSSAAPRGGGRSRPGRAPGPPRPAHRTGAGRRGRCRCRTRPASGPGTTAVPARTKAAAPSRAAGGPRAAGAGAPAAQRLHALRQLRHGGALEQVAHGQLHAEHLADARDDAHGHQRVPAQAEEVVRRAHPVDAQHLGPDRRQRRFGQGARRDVRVFVRARLRRGKGAAVHLAVGRQGQRVQRHEGGGDHVLRQAAPQVLAQRIGVRTTHDVGHQPPVARRVLAHDDCAVGDGGMAVQHGRHLARLDAEPADLHLPVQAAPVLHHPIGQPAGAVPGAVHPRAGDGRERVGDEALGRGGRVAQVAARHAVAARVQLAGHADGERRPGSIQHVDARVADGAADGHGPAAPRLVHRVAAGEGRVLRRPVAVDEPQRGEAVAHAAHGLHRQHVAAGQELAHAAQVVQPLLHHHLEQAGRQPQRRDAVMDDGAAELFDRGRAAGHEHHAAAVEQRAPDLQRGRVERDGRRLQDHRVRAEVRVVRAAHQAHDVPVLDRDALGPARAAGRVHHVRQPVRRGASIDVVRRARVDGRALRVQPNHARVRGGVHARRRSVRQQHGHARVRQHPLQPLRGIRQVQGHVGAARLEDGQDGDHHLHPPLQAEPHARLRAHAQRPQVVREAVGAGVQRRVRQRLVPQDDGDGVRRGADLLREQGVDGRRGIRRVRAVPVHQHPRPLRLAHQLQPGEGEVGVVGHPLQQARQVLQHPADGGALEEVRAVGKDAAQAARVRGKGEGKVELGGGEVRVQLRHADARQVHARALGVVQREHHLEEGRVAGAALRLQLLHQPLERHLRVAVRAQRGGAHPAQHLAERGVAGQVHAQGQRVDEEADQLLHAALCAPGDGGAHHHVVGAGVPAQQHLEGGQQHHVRGGALAAAQRLQPVRQPRGQVHHLARALVALHGGTGAVRGQLQQGGRAGQGPLPVRQLRVQPLALQRRALALGMVGVLRARRRQGRGAPVAERVVERGDLAEQDAHAPPVAHHVVHAQQQRVVVVGQVQERGAKERPGRQVEGAGRVVRRAGPQLVLACVRVQAREVGAGELQARERRDHLQGRAVGLRERRPQGFVPAHDLAQGTLQRVHVQQAPQAQRARHVVGGRRPLHPVQEPEPLLRERRTGGAGPADLFHQHLAQQLLLFAARQRAEGLGGYAHFPACWLTHVRARHSTRPGERLDWAILRSYLRHAVPGSRAEPGSRLRIRACVWK